MRIELTFQLQRLFLGNRQRERARNLFASVKNCRQACQIELTIYGHFYSNYGVFYYNSSALRQLFCSSRKHANLQSVLFKRRRTSVGGDNRNATATVAGDLRQLLSDFPTNISVDEKARAE